MKLLYDGRTFLALLGKQHPTDVPKRHRRDGEHPKYTHGLAVARCLATELIRVAIVQVDCLGRSHTAMEFNTHLPG